MHHLSSRWYLWHRWPYDMWPYCVSYCTRPTFKLPPFWTSNFRRTFESAVSAVIILGWSWAFHQKQEGSSVPSHICNHICHLLLHHKAKYKILNQVKLGTVKICHLASESMCGYFLILFDKLVLQGWLHSNAIVSKSSSLRIICACRTWVEHVSSGVKIQKSAHLASKNHLILLDEIKHHTCSKDFISMASSFASSFFCFPSLCTCLLKIINVNAPSCFMKTLSERTLHLTWPFGACEESERKKHPDLIR